MRKFTFILVASVILMLSCNEAMYDEFKWECDCEHEYVPIITQDSPFSWANDVPALRSSERTHRRMPLLDMEEVRREDMERSELGLPARFGYPHRVHYDLENAGEWIDLPDGSRLWQLNISSPGALAINVLFDKFWMPDGARFWVYSTDRGHSTNVITSIVCTQTFFNCALKC